MHIRGVDVLRYQLMGVTRVVLFPPRGGAPPHVTIFPQGVQQLALQADPAKPGEVGRFAGGARFLPRRAAKSRHIREPGRRVCVRPGVGTSKKVTATERWNERAGGTGAQIINTHTSLKNTCFFV